MIFECANAQFTFCLKFNISSRLIVHTACNIRAIHVKTNIYRIFQNNKKCFQEYVEHSPKSQKHYFGQRSEGAFLFQQLLKNKEISRRDMIYSQDFSKTESFVLWVKILSLELSNLYYIQAQCRTKWQPWL